MRTCYCDDMDWKLTLRGLVGLILTPIIFGAPLFLSAGTLNYWQGWVFLTVFSTATALLGVYLMKNNPALLARRMRVGPAAEKRPAQRIIMLCVLVSFALLVIVAGIDYRIAWSHLPTLVVLTGDFMVGLSYVVFYFVCRENPFASSTIELTEGQTVISTGLYHFVRHPMYSGGLLMWLGMPLALGSLWALVVVVALLPLLIWRIVDEEKFLAANLQGYTEYCDKVRYRLIPWLY